jgi:hypothetical protein
VIFSSHLTVRLYGSAIAQGSESWEKRSGERGRFFWTDTWLLRNGHWQIVAAEDLIALEKDRLAQFEKRCSHRFAAGRIRPVCGPVAGPVGRAVLCPPPAIYKIGAHGVMRPTINGPRGRGYSRSGVRNEYVRESPDFVEGVVKRRRRDANHVWFPKIAFYTRGDKVFM